MHRLDNSKTAAVKTFMQPSCCINLSLLSVSHGGHMSKMAAGLKTQDISGLPCLKTPAEEIPSSPEEGLIFF